MLTGGIVTIWVEYKSLRNAYSKPACTDGAHGWMELYPQQMVQGTCLSTTFLLCPSSKELARKWNIHKIDL